LLSSYNENIVSIVLNNSAIYGSNQKSTSIKPAKLAKKACSSLPLCFSTCDKTETNIPTAAILNIILTLKNVPPIGKKI